VKQTFKIPAFAPLAVAITAAVISQSTLAQPPPTPHQLVLTENSFTSLTATYDGSAAGLSVINISSDHWGITLSPGTTFSGSPQWTEPDNSSFVNVLTTFGNNQLIVNSDFFPNGTLPMADEGTFTNVGIDTRDGASISVTFDDDGDQATVPDTGSTFVLLCLSLGALLTAAKFRSLGLAERAAN